MTRVNAFMNKADLPMRAPSPYHDKRPDIWLALLDAIEAKPAGAIELAERFNQSITMVRRQLKWFRLAGIIHIESGSLEEPVYGYGGEVYKPPGKCRTKPKAEQVTIWGVPL